MRLMQLIGLRRLLPKTVRALFRHRWNALLLWEQHLKERRFYRQFIPPDTLVFDIGSNTGEKTAAFLSLGARVVAVEPNSSCTNYLLTRYREAVQTQRLCVECVAVAATNGELNLSVIDPDSGMCSAEPNFVLYARTIGYTGGEPITANAVTLDHLTKQYGLPDFIKIDVEGMDAEVLKGLSKRPRSLSLSNTIRLRLCGQKPASVSIKSCDLGLAKRISRKRRLRSFYSTHGWKFPLPFLDLRTGV
jgi:FkbM family methyltransferase